jgi:hypothetical protein
MSWGGNISVMPAKAGIHADSAWTPAFAGVTSGVVAAAMKCNPWYALPSRPNLR